MDQYFAAVLFAMATMSTAGYGARHYPFLVTNIHKMLSVGTGRAIDASAVMKASISVLLCRLANGSRVRSVCCPCR